MPQTILHSDLNSFYYSVSSLLDHSLRGKAFAVCGSAEDRHGIIPAKSDLAKRAGVKTGMTLWESRQLCPKLITVPPQYDEYIKYSKLAHEIYYRYTDLVEPFGMDECWMCVTDCLHKYKTPLGLAESIRKAMKNELGLTLSIGVSFNKIFAKLGSDMKKPDAITEITPENYKEKVWPLPVSELLYVGRATTAKLKGMGIRTIGELAAAPPEMLKLRFGVNGLKLWRFAAGLGDSRVMHKDYVTPIKSIGHGITCVSDLVDEEDVWKIILELSQDVGHRLRVHELAARGVQISVRGNDLYGCQFQSRLPFKTQLPGEIAEYSFRLFQERYSWKTKVRALCVRAIDLVPQDDCEQLSFFIDQEKRERRVRIQDAVEEICGRFGDSAISYAVLMGDIKMPHDGRELVKMPGIMYS